MNSNSIQSQLSSTYSDDDINDQNSNTELSNTNLASKFEVSMVLDLETQQINVQYQWKTSSKKDMISVKPFYNCL